MKILILHNSYQLRGGEDTVAEAEAEILRRAGHDVLLETASNSEIAGAADKLRTFIETPYAPQRREWAANLVRKTGAHIVHIHNFFPLLTFAAHEGAREAGAAVVQTLHNYRLLCANAVFLRNGSTCTKCIESTNIWGAIHRCYRDSALASLAVVRMQEKARRQKMWKHVDRFITLTDSAKSTFIAGGIPSERIAVKPNFADAPVTIRSDNQSRTGGLYIGRLAPEKGPGVLIEAWKSIPDHPLTIIGDGPERAALEAAAPPNVSFLGHLDRDAIAVHRAKAALLFVPSICRESFGMVAVEAFAAGLPVVASNIGALPDLIQEGITGSLVRPGSPTDISDAALKLLADASSLEKMGLAASTIYKERFTPEANVVALEKIYDDALRSRTTAN